MIRGAVLILLFLGAVAGAAAQIYPGERAAQEKGDIVFRTLAIPYNIAYYGDFHSAVYNEFSDPSSTTAAPGDLTLHSVLEMQGITGFGFDSSSAYAPVHIKVVSVSGIRQLSLRDFEQATQYWGAFTRQGVALPRGRVSNGTFRAGIVERAKQLKNRPLAIGYALQSGDRFYPNIIQTYATASGSGENVLVDDLLTMRSDAFVEYCYASVSYPILDQSIYKRGGLANLQRRAQVGGLTPKTQLSFAMSALVAPPDVTVFSGTTTIPAGGATALNNLGVEVDDVYSGPGRLELYKDGSLIAINNPPARDTDTYTYTSADIPELSALSNGGYVVRAIDQAGNVRAAGFTVDTGLPSLYTGPRKGPGDPSENPSNMMCLVFHATSTVGGSGIRRVSSSISGTAFFPPGTNPAVYASSACAPSTGTITVTAETWAGVVTNTDVAISSAPLNMTIAGSGSGWSNSGAVFVGDVPHPVQFIAHFDWSDCTTFKVTAQGKTLSCVPECGGCADVSPEI